MGVVEHHAPADTTLGMLQRGRGKGYLEVLAVPREQAREMLLECITRDPRMYSQFESREEYYASLAFKLDLDLEPVARHLREHDDKNQNGWSTPLAVGTLTELSKRGSLHATEILCDYIGWGQWWKQPLDDHFDLREAGPQVARAIEERLPANNVLEDELAWFDLAVEPWTTLARHSQRIEEFGGRAYRNDRRTGRSVEECVAEAARLSVRELLQQADESNAHIFRKAIGLVVRPEDTDLLMAHVSVSRQRSAAVALAGLEKLASPALFDGLFGLLTTPPIRTSALRIYVARTIVSLPAEVTLPYARANLHHPDRIERLLAEDIMQASATHDDIPMLRDALQRMLIDDKESFWRARDLVQAFCHFPGIGAVPELLAIYSQCGYSDARKEAARAIQPTAPELFATEFAEECLWDCESGTQTIGAASVSPSTASVLDRLRFLAADPLGDEKTKAAAAKRLETN